MVRALATPVAEAALSGAPSNALACEACDTLRALRRMAPALLFLPRIIVALRRPRCFAHVSMPDRAEVIQPLTEHRLPPPCCMHLS